MTETVSTKRNRVYKHKFDHDEARRMFEAGMSKTAIAKHFGVHWNSIHYVLNPAAYAKALETSARLQKSGTCIDCGRPCVPAWHSSSRHNVERCNRCATLHYNAKNVRPGEQRCTTCREWKPNWDFPHHKRRINGRHRECTSCGAKSKLAWARKNAKVCVGCGEKKVRPDNRSAIPLCLDCYRSGQRLVGFGARPDEIATALQKQAAA